MRCIWCGQPLRFEAGKGWVHEEGGLYVVKCSDCGWSGAPTPSPVQCPKCGSKALRDDHCALPREDQKDFD